MISSFLLTGGEPNGTGRLEHATNGDVYEGGFSPGLSYCSQDFFASQFGHYVAVSHKVVAGVMVTVGMSLVEMVWTSGRTGCGA